MSTFGDTQDTTNQDFTQEPLAPQAPSGPVGRPPLRRAFHGRMIGGVCAGLADYLGIDVTIVRVGFAVFAFMGGAGVPAYLACLLLIPEEGTDQSIAGSLFDGIR